jgi:hypothetical protein
MSKIIGTWSRSKGNITVTIKKSEIGRKYDYKAKYLGDHDDPVPPAYVEADLRKEFRKQMKMVPTSPRGGKVEL